VPLIGPEFSDVAHQWEFKQQETGIDWDFYEHKLATTNKIWDLTDLTNSKL